MESIKDLISKILLQTHTIVFGNLSRYLSVLYEALNETGLQIVVVSPYYNTSSYSESIRVIQNIRQSDLLGVDLLILVEPKPYTIILDKPAMVSRMLVLTSHLNFNTKPETLFSYIAYFHAQSQNRLAQDTKRLLEIQQGSVQTNSVNLIRVDAVNVQIVSGKSDCRVEGPIFVLIDLTSQKSSVFEMCLAFLDSFQWMLDCGGVNVHGWMICFPDKNSKNSFDKFFQFTLDRLFCLKINVGNATNLQTILPLLPYYRSGIVDKKFEFQKMSFGGIEYVAVDNPNDICKAVIMNDLEHLVGPVYRIK